MSGASVDAGSTDAHLAATRIVAVRHGETAWNVDTRIQGQLDIGLNALGRRQAEQVATALVSEGLEAIYSSDLLRAHETARAIGRACGLAVHTDVGLRERAFGEFEGHTWDEIAERWPEQSARWRARDPAFKPQGGESLLEFHARVIAACARLAQRHAGRCIALVAHGGVMDVLRRAATRVDLAAPRTWSLGNATINRLLHADAGFSLVGWGDASHLGNDAPERAGDEASTAASHAGDGVGHTA